MTTYAQPQGGHAGATTAVLLLAYGSPEAPADLAAYLQDVRGGRPTSPALLAEIQSRYAAIGGPSPLTRLTFAQATATAAELARRGHDLPVYVGMRHWQPWIADTVAAMAQAGVTSFVSLVLAPHYSRLSIGRYRERVASAVTATGQPLTWHLIDSWAHQEKLLATQAEHLRAALAAAPLPAGARRKVLFTAHSLPARILADGDPYPAELRGNAEAMAARVPGLDWQMAYQSAGASPEPWLGPQVKDLLPELAAAGYTDVLVQPLGFVCDHIEILYDLDVEAQAAARALGLRLTRTASMNTAPGFIAALADALVAALP